MPNEIKLNTDQMLKDLLAMCRKNLRSVDEKLITKAFNLSFEAHQNDIRISGKPYFTHPYEVAMFVAQEIPLDDISVVGALLHDVVEDTGVNIKFLRTEFGDEVADIVDGVTKIGGVFAGHEITQAENYRKMLLSMVKDIRVILVKSADRLHNMRTLDHLRPDKQRRIAKETLELYAPFANRFGLGRVKWELEDLAFKFLNKEAYNEIARKIILKRNERETYINKFKEPIAKKLKDHGLEFEIGGRPKHLYSIYRKMIKLNASFEEIYDLLAVRIILESNDDNECFYVLGVINQMYKPISERFKDYISIPKKNNYQSIHNTVIGPEGKVVEIQIRTRKMHEIAERGVAAHWKYKENLSSTDADLADWVNWIRDVFENASKNEATKEILASFKLNLYQDEIYVFTPNGDLKRLPRSSTPVDFAYEIHSNIGFHCIGAKVNGKIVPLDTKLNSGDQVEIITSKNQSPNKSWLRFVTTHKAKADIRKFLNRAEEKLVETGKEIWIKKIKKLKLVFTSEDISKLSRKLKYDNPGQFYRDIALDKLDLDDVLSPEETKEEQLVPELQFDKFADQERKKVGNVIVDDEHKGIATSFAKCCSPIPGDPIIGFITIGEGIKIHKKDCKNLISMAQSHSDRLVPVEWPRTNGSTFAAGITLSGEDVPGILKDISNSITTYKNTNIKAVNINASDSIFEGTVTVYVNDIEHLNRLMERLKKIKCIYHVERFEHSNQQ